MPDKRKLPRIAVLLAQKILSRIREQGYPINGKKAGHEALSCMCGAAMMMDALGCGMLAKYVSGLAFLVSVRGAAELLDFAEADINDDDLAPDPSFFTWTVQFGVDECWVADGFNLDDEAALDMIGNRLGYANVGTELFAHVIDSPLDAHIKKAQGYITDASHDDDNNAGD